MRYACMVWVHIWGEIRNVLMFNEIRFLGGARNECKPLVLRGYGLPIKNGSPSSVPFQRPRVGPLSIAGPLSYMGPLFYVGPL